MGHQRPYHQRVVTTKRVIFFSKKFVEHPSRKTNSKTKYMMDIKSVQKRKSVVLLPWTKKEPSSRFAARRTLFHVWYHARSGAISAGQVRSATVRDFCPALIAPDRAWYHTWNSVLPAANLDDGSFFLSRVIVRAYFYATRKYTH